LDIFCFEVVPYEPLNLRRVQFWLRIMKEHSLFMKLGFSCDDVNLIQKAEKFYGLFEEMQKDSQRIQNEEEFMCFVKEIMGPVQNLFIFKRNLLHQIVECKIGGFNYPLLIDHISREAMYFYKILEKIQDGDLEYPVDSIVSDNVFWLRHMADHARFIAGLLDPSERGFVDKANAFAGQFEQLELQARDLDSMLWHSRPNHDLVRFEKEATAATVQIRDFKEAARDLIKACQVVSLIPSLLADHVMREAEYFLEVLSVIQEDLATTSKPIITCG
jgi:hypothetical protein